MLIRNGRLLEPASGVDRTVDVYLHEGRVAAIEPPGTLAAEGGASVLDATGHWILPGLVDLHVHLREPGFEYKEDIASGSRAAAAGGFTSIVAMANTSPVIDNAELVAFVARRGREAGHCRVLPVGAVTVGLRGEQLAPLGEMAAAGAVAFSDDGHPVADAGLMRSALEYSQNFERPVLTHAEECGLSRGGHMHEGRVATRLGLQGIPGVAEDAAVARDIFIAEHTGGHLHVCHVSTAASVELVRAAKRRGARVTAEAAPHHFTLSSAAVEGFRTHAKMNPPLREEVDRQAVVAGLADGTLDAIATDHAPHSVLEKEVAFQDAANGIIGLETALPLSLRLWREEGMPLMDVVARLTHGPAGVMGSDAGRLRVGGPADLVVVDPERRWQPKAETRFSKSKNTPFDDWQLQGRAVLTVCDGRVTHQISD